MTDGVGYDPTGTDSALPTVDSGWPSAYDPSDDSPRLTETTALGRHGLGLVALVVAVFVIVATVVASVVIGGLGGQFATDRTADSFTYNLDVDSALAHSLSIATGWQYIIGTALGVWAIVQGIVAIAKKRGRLFGALAIVIAAAGPLISVVVTLGAASQNLPR
ncbi:MAG: hypothetical protein QOD50_2244 [Actinomycetota bacterium]|jgi:hypothetical protein|nr:hypothetical protein [Actinomycetota bacterium]